VFETEHLLGLGDEPAGLVGAVVINQIKQAAAKVRVPYDLYIDEFQNFGPSIISTILSESGKFGLNLVLARSSFRSSKTRCGTPCSATARPSCRFAGGLKDSPIIADALDWSEQDLQDLPGGTARFRTLWNGRPTSALLLQTDKTLLPTGRLQTSVRTTRANFARQRTHIDKLQKKHNR
jgi:hypothetical protein